MNKALIILATLYLSSCTNNTGIKKAEQLCLHDSGLKRLSYPSFLYEIHVYCNSGKRIIIAYKNFNELEGVEVENPLVITEETEE